MRPLDTSPSLLPRPLGPYLLVHRLAKGGMGEVYLAKHKGFADIEKYVVVKTMRSRYTKDDEYVARFVNEARIVVQLSHRNICQVFDVGKLGQQYYLAMELIAGRDVRALEARAREAGRTLPEALVLHLVCEVLEALDYAHRHAHPLSGEPMNLVHRDVSPQNVMVNFEGEVKLIDFGLAQSRLLPEQTNPEVVLGKLAYMSREQLHGEPLDGRSDLFAVGVMAYELLTGERYYEGMSQADIWDVVASGDHAPRRFSQLPEGLQPILKKALARDRERRFSSCAEMKDALETYRLVRGMNAGARELRHLMDILFDDDKRALRELLRGFAEVEFTPTGPTEKTESIAQVSGARAAAPGPSVHDLVLPPAEEATGRTRRTERMPAAAPARSPHRAPARSPVRRPVPRHLAIAVGGIAIAGIGAALSLPPRDAPSVAAAQQPADETPAEETVPDEIEPEPPVLAAIPSPAAIALSATASDRAPSEAPKPTAKTAARAAAKKAPPARKLQAKRSRKPAVTEPRLPPQATSAEKLEFLRQHCRKRTRCAAPLVADRGKLDGMAVEEVARFWRQVKACLDACQP